MGRGSGNEKIVLGAEKYPSKVAYVEPNVEPWVEPYVG